jgi:hypothetical protein
MILQSAVESVPEPNDLEDIRSRYRHLLVKAALDDPTDPSPTG